MFAVYPHNYNINPILLPQVHSNLCLNLPHTEVDLNEITKKIVSISSSISRTKIVQPECTLIFLLFECFDTLILPMISIPGPGKCKLSASHCEYTVNLHSHGDIPTSAAELLWLPVNPSGGCGTSVTHRGQASANSRQTITRYV